MKSLSLLILFTCFSLFTRGQTVEDTFNLAWDYIDSAQYEEAILIGQEMIIGDDIWSGLGHEICGVSNLFLGNSKECIKNHLVAEKIFRESEDPRIIRRLPHLFQQLGISYINLSEDELAIEYLSNSISLYRDLKETLDPSRSNLINSLNLIARLYSLDQKYLHELNEIMFCEELSINKKTFLKEYVNIKYLWLSSQFSKHQLEKSKMDFENLSTLQNNYPDSLLNHAKDLLSLINTQNISNYTSQEVSYFYNVKGGVYQILALLDSKNEISHLQKSIANYKQVEMFNVGNLISLNLLLIATAYEEKSSLEAIKYFDIFLNEYHDKDLSPCSQYSFELIDIKGRKARLYHDNGLVDLSQKFANEFLLESSEYSDCERSKSSRENNSFYQDRMNILSWYNRDLVIDEISKNQSKENTHSSFSLLEEQGTRLEEDGLQNKARLKFAEALDELKRLPLETGSDSLKFHYLFCSISSTQDDVDSTIYYLRLALDYLPDFHYGESTKPLNCRFRTLALIASAQSTNWYIEDLKKTLVLLEDAYIDYPIYRNEIKLDLINLEFDILFESTSDLISRKIETVENKLKKNESLDIEYFSDLANYAGMYYTKQREYEKALEWQKRSYKKKLLTKFSNNHDKFSEELNLARAYSNVHIDSSEMYCKQALNTLNDLSGEYESSYILINKLYGQILLFRDGDKSLLRKTLRFIIDNSLSGEYPYTLMSLVENLFVDEVEYYLLGQEIIRRVEFKELQWVSHQAALLRLYAKLLNFSQSGSFKEDGKEALNDLVIITDNLSQFSIEDVPELIGPFLSIRKAVYNFMRLSDDKEILMYANQEAKELYEIAYESKEIVALSNLKDFYITVGLLNKKFDEDSLAIYFYQKALEIELPYDFMLDNNLYTLLYRIHFENKNVEEVNSILQIAYDNFTNIVGTSTQGNFIELKNAIISFIARNGNRKVSHSTLCSFLDKHFLYDQGLIERKRVSLISYHAQKGELDGYQYLLNAENFNKDISVKDILETKNILYFFEAWSYESKQSSLFVLKLSLDDYSVREIGKKTELKELITKINSENCQSTYEEISKYFEDVDIFFEDRKSCLIANEDLLVNFDLLQEILYPYKPKFEIRYLANFSSIYRPNIGFIPNESAILFGNPTFGSQTNKKETFNALNHYSVRGMNELGQWLSLEATDDEIREINDYLASVNLDTKLFSSAKSSEENLRNIEQPNILHIATHTFDDGYTNGLVLSNANNVQNINPNDLNDGYFYAVDFQELNLDLTNLVTLSSCNSGDSSHTFNMKNQIFRQGCGNLLVSLWPIDDRATKDFMTIFYENYIESNRLEFAFSNASKRIDLLYPENPYFSKSFLLLSSDRFVSSLK